MTPSAASRSRSASVSPHSSASTSLLCCPSVGGGRCSHCPRRRAGRTADTDTDRVRCSDASGVRRSRGAPVAGSRSPAIGETTTAAGIPAAASRSTADAAVLGGEPLRGVGVRPPMSRGQRVALRRRCVRSPRSSRRRPRTGRCPASRAEWPRLPRRSRNPAEQLEFHCLHGGHVEHGLDHRHLDELAAAGAVGELECRHQRERRVRARERIAGAARGDRRPVGQARSPRPDPAICSIVGANPTRSRHGPVSPNAGIRTITSRGLSSSSDVGAEAELVHHPRREVLDHHVGLR